MQFDNTISVALDNAACATEAPGKGTEEGDTDKGLECSASVCESGDGGERARVKEKKEKGTDKGRDTR